MPRLNKNSYYLEIQNLEKMLSRIKAQEGNLLSFTCYTKDDYEVNWHHRVVAKIASDFAKGKKKRVILIMPPRCGKTELVSRRLVPLIHGINPQAEIILGTYNAALAADVTADIQRVMDQPEYAEIFPDSRITAANKKTDFPRNAHEHELLPTIDPVTKEVTFLKGKYRAQGVSGSFSGRGAHFCFIAGTNVLTSSGNRPIETLTPGEEVLSYDKKTCSVTPSRIKTVFSRRVSRVVQVQTACGRRIICTPDHPFWVLESGYKEVQALKFGDRLLACGLSKSSNANVFHYLRFLFKRIQKGKFRLSKIGTAWPQGILLFKQMLKRSSQYKKSSSLRNLQGENVEKNTQVLRQMQVDLFDESPSKLRSSFSKYTYINKIKRLVFMCKLRISKVVNGSPYRFRQNEQRYRKFDYALSEVSYETPPNTSTDCFESMEEISGGPFTVYDIEVERNHNFFVEGILVHNCILDDLIKNRADADSEVIREAVWKWYVSTLRTRLEKDGSILITLCLTGDTSVLMADGTETFLRDLKVGDAIATYDRGKISTSTVRNWKCHGPDSVYKIRMSSGITVKANERHPFLVCENGELKWVRLRDLKVSDSLMSVGENGKGFSARQTDVTISSLNTEIQNRFCAPQLSTYEPILDCIEEISKVEDEDVFDIQVDRTENFIANGLVSHNTRWHEDDIVGRLLKLAKENPEADQWEVIRFPAIKEDESNAMDPRKIGEPLWPNKFSLAALMATKAAGARDWNSLQQGRPTSEEGNLFKREHFKFFTEWPKNYHEQIQSWDMAVKDKQTSDFTVGTMWGRIGPYKYLLAEERGHFSFPEVCNRLVRMSNAFPMGYKKLIEAKANGPAVKQTLDQTVSGIVEVEPRGDKVARVHAILPEFESGHVWFPSPSIAPWIEDFVEELCSFPNGMNDDRCDSVSQGLDALRGLKNVEMPTAGHGSGVMF